MNELQVRKLMRLTATPVELRFWSKVGIIDDTDSCWLWNGSRHPEGYGHFSWKEGPFSSDRSIGAHRVAHLFATGEIPTVVRHTCDNPPCVRPKHLVGGSTKDNSHDRWSKVPGWTPPRTKGPRPSPQSRRGTRKGGQGTGAGGALRGTEHGMAKVSEADIITIRERFANEESTPLLATEFGVKPNTINKIVTGATWPHVGGPITRNRNTHGKLKTADVRAIKARLADGDDAGDIAADFGVTRDNIYAIRRGRSWKEVH